MERIPLVPVAIAFAAGTAAVVCNTPELRFPVALVFAALCLCCCNGRTSDALRVAILIALAAGALHASERSATRPELNATVTQRFQIIVIACTPLIGRLASQCAVQIAGGGPRVLATLNGSALSPGSRAIVRARLSPFDGPRNPGEPDRASIERERGFDGLLEGATVLQRLPAASSASWDVFLARLHARALQRLQQSLGEPYASIVAGELWGERATLPPDLRQEFQDSGTMHILVTAGLHLGLVAALAAWLLGFLPLPRVLSCALIAAVVWAYAGFSGEHLPAVRAAVMVSFALAARAAGAKAFSWNALACALIVTLALRPESLLSASFAMSFSCCGAILLLAAPIDAALERAFGLPDRVREVLSLTLATQAGVWPVTAATFLLFAPYSVLANAAIVPLAGPTMLLGALQIAVPVPSLAAALANLNAWLLQWMLSAVRLTSALPLAHVVMTPASAQAILAYDVAVAGGVWLWNRGARTAALAAVLVTAGFIIAPFPSGRHDLVITVLDVGQADSIVIQTPRGHTLLVDGGGRLERGARSAADSTAEQVGEQIVVPFLIRAGIHHLDAVLLSHQHGDHAGGIAPVLRTLGAQVFADTGQRYGGFAYRDALAVAHERSIALVYPRGGTVWRTDDGVSLTFLGPTLPLITGSRNDINNNSLVFMLQYRHFRMLFTGDAGAEAERRILNTGSDVQADVRLCTKFEYLSLVFVPSPSY